MKILKKVFYQSDISTLLCKDKIEVTSKFIRDFEYLINLVDQLDKRIHIEKLKSIKDYEMISFIDIIKTLCENREKINEIIERMVNK